MSALTHALPQAANNQQGFYLWVGLNPDRSDTATAEPTTPAQIVEIAEALGELARELLPTAETHTTLALGEHEQTTHARTQQPAATAHGSHRYYAPHTQRRQAQTSYPTGQSQPQLTTVQAYQSGPRVTQNAGYPTAHGSVPNFDFVFSPRVIVDLHNRRVIADEQIQRLTYKEFELLAHLVSSPSRIISRDELFNSVWRTAIHNDSRTIDVHIRRLREKLGLENHIITVRGAGYKFELTEQIDVIPPAPRPLHR